MEETAVVLMQKDQDTGFLDKELGSYKIVENEEFIINLFAEESEGMVWVHMKLSTERDVLDWEFSAIFDYYEEAVMTGYSISEVDDCFNPTWEVGFPFEPDVALMESRMADVLRRHKNELLDVYETIRDKEEEYL